MNKIYKIKKSFQGGSTIYYARMGKNKKLRRACWDFQLQEWGEMTIGGHGYGYDITANRVKNKPKGCNILRFNKHYLEKKK